MIKTISDFLLRLIEAEKKHIDSQNITHAVTIGNMYEGLTKDVLDISLFKDLNLNIVTNSFIRDKQGKLSDEMDILIIEGKGNQLPHTNQFVIDVGQVIAVVQVKKRLNKQSITEGYHNLKNVVDISDSTDYEPYHKRLLIDSYQGICGEHAVENGKFRTHFDSTTKEGIFHILKEEVLLPPRILMAYEGYASEKTLRDGFVGFLTDNVSTEGNLVVGYSPLNFPNLILNGNISVIKNNGMPFLAPLINGNWPFYTTNRVNPINNLLEVIWTRLSYKFNISSDIFGDGLALEGVNNFLMGNIVNVGGFMGWNFNYTALSKKTLDKEMRSEDWQPVKLTPEAHYIVAYLCKHESLLITKVNAQLAKLGFTVDLDSLVQSLLSTNLVYLDGYKYLRLLTKQCKCFISKDGYFAADDHSGKLSRWVAEHYGNDAIDNPLSH